MPVSPNGPEFRVNTYTTGEQVTYDPEPFNPSAAPSGQQSFRKVAMAADGRYVVVWASQGQDNTSESARWGVYAQLYNADGTVNGGPILVNTVTRYDQLAPAVAMDTDGDFVVTWSSYYQSGGGGTDVDGFGIYGQRYSSTGTTLGSTFQINTTTLADQLNSSIAMQSDGSFVVSWSNGFTDEENIVARRYTINASGVPVAATNEVVVNTTPTANSQQRSSNLAVDSTGRFVVVWEANGKDGDRYGIYGRAYNADGTAIGSEFLINTYTTGDQRNPSIAMDTDGDFVVTWWGAGAEDGVGIYARRFKIDSAAPGTGVTAKTEPDGKQYKLVNLPNGLADSNASVVMDAQGNYVVTWTSNVAGDNDIYFRRFKADGTLYAEDEGTGNLGQTRANTTTLGDQSYSGVALDGSGNFILTWTSSDGSGKGVYARQFTVTSSGNQDPTDITLAPSSVNEDAALNFEIGTLTTSDPDGDTAFTYTLVPGQGDNDKFTIINDRLHLNAALDFEAKPSYTVQIKTDDGKGGAFIKDLTITVNNVNEQPTGILISNGNIAEGTPADTLIGNFSTEDPDAGNTFTYSLAAGIADNDAFKLVGNQLFTKNPLDFENKPTYTLQVTSTDQDGLSVSKAITINVTNVNEQPTNITLSPSTVAENSPTGTDIGTLTTTDPDGQGTFTYQLVNGAADNALFTIAADKLQVNSALDFETKQSYTVQVQVTDSDGLTFTKDLTVGVTNVNEAPTSVSLTPSTIDENTPTNVLIGNLAAIDPDGDTNIVYTLATGVPDNDAFQIVGNELRTKDPLDFETKSTYNIQIVATDQNGTGLSKTQDLVVTIRDVFEDPGNPTDITLDSQSINENTAANIKIGAFTTTDPTPGDSFTYTLDAGVADNDAFAIVGNELRTKNPLDFETQSTYTIRVKSTDVKGGSFTKDFTIQVGDVNEDPTSLTLDQTSIAENSPTSTPIGTFNATDPDAGTVFTYTLDTGIADNDRFAISGNQLVTKDPLDFETKPTYTITVKVSDQGGRSFTQDFTIDVTDINEAPTDITLSPSNIDENTPAATDIGTFTTVDPDGDTTFTYSLVAGVADNDNFAISGNKLVTKDPLDFETKPTYTIRVTVNDQKGGIFSKDLTVDVNDLPEGPQDPTNITLSNQSVAENTATNVEIGTFTTTDPTPGDTFVYALTPGILDNDVFTLVGDKLFTKAPLNFEAKQSYTIRVKTTDQGGTGVSLTKDITINVTNVNEQPTDITISKNTIAENTPADTVIGNFNTLDPDTGGSFTYSLAAGVADNDAFKLQGNQLLVKDPLNFESKSVYTLQVTSTDQGGLSFTKSITINVLNVNEAPTDIILTPNKVDENTIANTAIGTLTTADPDGDTSFTYTLAAGVLDNDSFTLSGDQIFTKAPLDFETKPTYTIRVVTTDGGGKSVTKDVVIGVNDLPETPGSTNPTDLILNPSAINENVPNSTLVGTLSTIDPDQGDTFTYELVSGAGSTDNAAFTLTTDGKLSINASPDFETKSTYSIRVRTTDAGNKFLEKVFTVSINNLPETPGSTDPRDIILNPSAIDENVPATTLVGTLTTVDPDQGDTFTYALVTGTGSTDNAAFTLSTDGKLSINASPDFEAKPTYSIRVRTTDAGNRTFEKVLTVSINDLPELPGQTTPTDVVLNPSAIDENVPATTLVGTLSTVDPDQGDTFTYALVTGTGSTDNAAFTLTTDGKLSINASPDFEQKSSYSIRVRTTDSGNKSLEKVLTVSINNLPELPGQTTPTDVVLNPSAIDENVPATTLVGTLTTVDPDQGDTFTYALVTGTGSTDNAAFTLTPDGKLSINASPDFEQKSSYSIRVRTTDSGNKSLEKVLTVSINNLPENPGDTDPRDILLSPSTIDENVPATTLVGTLSTVDPDQGDTFTYALVTGTGSTDNAAFTLTPDGKLSINASPDFEQKSSYSIRVRTTDAGNRTFEKILTVSINDLPETPGSTDPRDILLSPSSINENVPATTLVGTLSTVDPDQGDTFTYALVTGTGSTDNAAFTLTTDGKLSINASPDFEQKSSYSIRVRTTDAGNRTFEKILTVSINDLPETPGSTDPRDILLSPSAINENVPATTLVGTLTTVDPDQGDTFTYALVSGTGSTDNAAFTLTADGKLSINASPDFEQKSSYSIRVRTTDAGNRSLEKVLTVSINNLPENPGDTDPRDILLSPSTINENVPATTLVGTLTTVDPDQGDTFTYALVSGTGSTDNAAFTLTADGKLSINASPDFEAKPTYSIRVRTTDFGNRTFEKVLVVNVNNIAEPPVVTTSTGAASYSENGAAITIDSGISVSDIDSTQLTRASIALGGYVPGQDQLQFTNQNGISGNFDTATGILTLTGNASLAAYQTALRSIRYLNSSDGPDTTPRTIRFTITDEANLTSNIASRTIQIVPNNDAPTVTTSAGALAYTEKSGAVAVDPGIVVNDVDSATLTRAEVTLTNYSANQDLLGFTNVAGITGNFDAATGKLTFTGSASVSEYQAVLRSITYTNTSDNPTPSRTLQVTVTDEALTSTTATRAIQITPVNSAPVVSTSDGALSYLENAAPVAIDPALTLSDADSANLQGAVVTLNGYVTGQDELDFANQNGISGTYSTASGKLTLTLSGTASVAAYQNALRSITYHNNSDIPSAAPRSLQITVNDAALSSNSATKAIQVIPVNDAPVVSLSVSSVAFSETNGAVTLDPGVALSDLDNTQLSGATIALGGYVVGQDNLLFNNQNGISGSFNAVTGVLTLTGQASIANYRTALRSILYTNNSDTPNRNPRTVAMSVTDGISSSSAATLQILFDSRNINPVLDLNGSGGGVDFNSTYVMTGPAVPIVAADSTLTDGDSQVLNSAQVVISNLYNGKDESLLVNTSGTGIAAAYNPEQGVLSLTGVASVSTYLQVLRSIQYQNRATNLDMTTRTILFSVSDGTGRSEPAQTTVQITPVNLLNQGSGGDDQMVTTPATDLLDAQAGNDTLSSVLEYLQQNDNINGGAGSDTLILQNGTGNAFVDVSNTASQVSGILSGNTTIHSFEFFDFSGFAGSATMMGSDGLNDQLTGGSGSDVLMGKAGNDRLLGNAGNDRLDGGSGNDTLIGGAGDDTYIVDSANDLIIDAVSSGFDSIIASLDWTLAENLDDLTLTGKATTGTGNDLNNGITGNDQNNTLLGNFGNDILIGATGKDTLSGGSGDDRLQGDNGNDRLQGNAGRDSLDGGLGKDRLTGGKGKDRFYLSKARQSSLDTITDFRAVDDTVVVSRKGFDRTLKLGTLRGSQFVLGSRAADANDRFIYNARTGGLFFDEDGLGGAAQVQIAFISNRSKFTAGDISIAK